MVTLILDKKVLVLACEHCCACVGKLTESETNCSISTTMVKAVNLNSKQRQKVFWSGSHFSLVTLSICSPWLRWPKMIGFVVPALPWWHSDTSGVAAAPDTTVWCCNLVASCPSCRRHQWARLPATDHNNEPSKSNGEAAVDSRTSAKQWWVLCVWGGQQCGPCPPPLLWQEG